MIIQYIIYIIYIYLDGLQFSEYFKSREAKLA